MAQAGPEIIYLAPTARLNGMYSNSPPICKDVPTLSFGVQYGSLSCFSGVYCGSVTSVGVVIVPPKNALIAKLFPEDPPDPLDPPGPIASNPRLTLLPTFFLTFT